MWAPRSPRSAEARRRYTAAIVELRAEVLGPVGLWCGEAPVDVAVGKPRALVALLALQGGRPVAPDSIIDALWGDDPPTSAANAVQVYVSAIRRALRAAGVSEPRGALATSGAGYALAVDAGAVDATRFEFLVEQATHALDAGDAPGAARDLRAALALWRGERALADVTEAFADTIRTRFDELRLVALERRIDADLALGAAAELVGEMEQLVAAWPYRESLWERLMTALYRAGRQADALAAFARARAVLVEELGIDPGPGLVALETAILRQDDTLAPVARAPVAPDGQGAARPAAPQPARVPARAAGVLGLHALPPPFVGRRRDLDGVDALLRDPSTRLVTLTGPGGAGKTRLAVELVRGALDDFDVVAFVDLAATTDAAAIAPAVAGTLGLDPSDDPIDAIANALTGTALVVLDNLEQVSGAPGAVAALVARVDTLTVLATSRTALRLGVEVDHRLGPLDEHDASAMFRARAGALGVELATDEASQHMVQRICDRLDRLPLALELAAARVRLLSLDALDAHLERDGLGVLARGRADTPERHQTLDAAIAWSVDLLDDRPRELYELLGCFHGGATIDAIQSVSTTDAMALLDDLDTLVDASLLPPPDLTGATPRFRMLETIRADAARRCGDRGDAMAIADLHADFFARAAATRGVLQPNELADVRAATRHLIDHGRLDAAAALATDARNVFFDSGALRDAIEWYRELLGLELAPLSRARVAILAGTFAQMLDQSDGVEELLHEGIALMREAAVRDPVGVNAFCYLGLIALNRREGEAADAFAMQAVDWARGHDPAGESMALDFHAYVTRQLGDPRRAAELQAQAVHLARTTEPPERLAQRLAGLARAYLAVGADTDARTAAHEALLLAVRSGSRPAERDAQTALGESMRPIDLDAAVAALGRAALLAREVGQGAIEELVLLARALHERDDDRAALLFGVAARAIDEAGTDDEAIAAVVAHLQAELDGRRVAAGRVLDAREVDDLVRRLAAPRARQLGAAAPAS